MTRLNSLGHPCVRALGRQHKGVRNVQRIQTRSAGTVRPGTHRRSGNTACRSGKPSTCRAELFIASKPSVRMEPQMRTGTIQNTAGARNSSPWSRSGPNKQVGVVDDRPVIERRSENEQLEKNLITSLVLGILISSLVLIAPLTGNSQPTASVSFSPTINCHDKVVKLLSPTTGDASTPQTLDIVVSNATYYMSNGGEVFFLATDVFAVDSADASNVIAATTFSLELLPGCCVDGFNPLLFRATFNFGSANACKTFNFYVTTKCLGTNIVGESEPGGSFTLDCPFAALTAKVKIDKGPRRSDDKFDVQGTFILAPASNGIDLLTEDFDPSAWKFLHHYPCGFLRASTPTF